MGSPLRCVAILILALASLSCSQHHAEGQLDNYLERLARTLNVDLEKVPHAPHEPFSNYQWGYADNVDAQSAGSISVLDFLALYGCDLQLVIAEGNSNLGKFAPPSQVLLRHLKFLHYAPACIEQLNQQDKHAIAQQLSKAQQEKAKSLPDLIWQALLNEQEAKAFWKQPLELGTYPQHISIDPELALRRLTHLSRIWLAENKYLDGSNELEKLLSDIRKGDGGSLLSASSLLNQKLQRANRVIEHYLQQESCAQGRPSFDKNILQNVISKFFVGEVQVWAAELNKRYYSLIDAYQIFERQFQGIESDLYKTWRLNRDKKLAENMRSPSNHVKHLQSALEACQGPKQKDRAV